MFCENCGKPLDEGTKFCLYCGATQGADIKEEDDATIPMETDFLGESNTGDTAVPDFGGAPRSEDVVYPEERPDAGIVQAVPAVPTVPTVPTVQPQVVKPEKRRKKPMRAVPTVFLCVLFSLLTFVFAVVATSLWEVRSTLQKGSVSEAATEVNPLKLDAKDVITNTKALDEAISEIGILNVEIVEPEDGETLGEWIERAFANYGTTEDDAEQFLEESELMPYLTDVAASYENYLLTGEDDKTVTDKKLKTAVEKCLDYISDEFDYEFAPDYEEHIDEFFDKRKNDIKAASPSNALGDYAKYIRYCLSLPAIIAAAVLALIFVILAGVITKRPDAAFITFGIPVTLCGILFAFVGLFPELVLRQVRLPSGVMGESAEVLVADFAKLGAIEAAAGLVFIVGFIVYRVVASKLAKKKALQNA